MSRADKRRVLRLDLLEPRCVLDSTVVFNELMYNPAGPSETLEFIELHNQMAVDLDISGWRLDGGVNYRFPEGTIIDGGGHLVIASDPFALSAANPSLASVFGPYVGQLDNDGEQIELRDRSDRQMDVIDYRDEDDWPVAADGSGASLTKRSPNLGSEPPESWTFSPQVGGTAGARNFPDLNAPPQSRQVILSGDSWSYDASGGDLSTAWREVGYNDTGWASGPSLLYAGSGQLATVTPVLLTGVNATASTEYMPDGRLAIDAVNGNGLNGNQHSTDVGAMWLTNGPSDPAPLITFDLGAVYPLDQMRVWNYNEYRPDLPMRILELLGRGVDQVDILIAGANQVYQPLFTDYHFPVVTTTTTNTDFSHTVNFGGALARYVRFDIDSNHNGRDYNNPLDNDNFGNYVGLSEVQFYKTGDERRTEVALGSTTDYFRREFTFADDPARTQLLLNTAVDDGAVYYLNGVEIYRHNMPAGPVTHGTLAATAVPNPSYTGAVQVPNGGLVQGANVLAVEVHQAASAGDPDMVFAADLTAIIAPLIPGDLSLPLAFNEVSGGDAAPFTVELVNHSGGPLSVGGYVVQSSTGAEHVLAAQTLPSGGFLALTNTQLGFTPASGDRLYLLAPSRNVVADALEVKTTSRGRSPDGTGPWLRPSAATPGAANTFALHDEIVINEIMYHHRPDPATTSIPAIYDTQVLLPINTTWKYNRSYPTTLPSPWYQTNYTPGVGGDPGWVTGAGLIGRETTPTALPAPLVTTWSPFSSGVLSYYFQIEFTFNGVPEGSELFMRHVIDDGAVFYLNGSDLTDAFGGSTRFNMPATAIARDTLSSGAVDNAAFSSYIALDPTDFVIGTNRLSVEVHQQASNSSDIVFGLELAARTLISPPIPGDPFTENDEEWVELYNRGLAPVDLSGWELDKAVNYTFTPGTIIGPGEYLVVAKDSAALRAAYPSPAIEIVGDFSGSLGNETDRIVLRDNVGNPADEVRYFEDGRWPIAADGNGSSLELRDPRADNSSADAWAASNEADTSPWTTYTYSGTASPSAVGPDGQWHEFLLGMLDDGEVLFDDIRVTEQPGPAGLPMLLNGSFDSDTVGMCPSGWRCLGNHSHSEVIVDPDNAANKVLRFVATGPTEHMHNHLETTYAGGQQVDNGATYEISFRAKWITGSPLLNSRLYFNRLPRTTSIAQPALHGTPGTQNSAYAPNIGPTYEDLRHDPVVPAPAQPVTVTATAADPDGVANMTLYYSVQGGAFASVAMTHQGGGVYAGIIPGQAAGALVQFYIQGQDGHAAPATSMFPAAGPDSRAMYKVNDNLASNTGIHNLRILITPQDANWLHTDYNLMSNDFVPATVIYDEREVFYGASVRLSGSERARPYQPRLAFFVRFPSDHLFRGVHGSFILDRSDSTGFGQREILVDHAMGAAGVVPSLYNDLIHIMTPRSEHTGGALLELARYSQNYLDEQFDNGGEGALFEYELVYFPTTANPQGFKLPQPDGTAGTGLTSLGSNPDSYRWNYLVKNNRGRDDFSRLIQWLQVQGTSGGAYVNQIPNVVDIDQWLRAAALSASSGYGDQWGGDGSQHNAQFYIRPEDNRVLFFPHDLDAFFSTTRPLIGPGEIIKLLNDAAWPNKNNAHHYYGHMHDIVSNTYNTAYMTQFANNYASLQPAQAWSTWLSELGARSANVLTQLAAPTAAGPNVAYAITTPGPLNVASASTAVINGTGWVNVRELRLAGSDRPLDVTWTTTTAWRVTLPVDNMTGLVTIEAYDFRGNLLGSRSITITSTAPRPIVDQLRVVELMYNPDGNGDADEYIELANISATAIPSLSGVRFSDGVTFTFGNIGLAPGERILVVRDVAGFEAQYGIDRPVVGAYTGSALENNGERITLVDAEGAVIQDFTYDDTGDGWHPTTDGGGYSLVVVDESSDPATWSEGSAWRPSAAVFGSPGEPDLMLGDFDLNNRVDLADLAFLQARLETDSGATALTGDLTGDGAVDRNDTRQFTSQFGRFSTPSPPSPAASAAAPAAVIARATRTANAPPNLRATALRARLAAVDAAMVQIERSPDALSVVGTRRSLRAYATRSSATVERNFGPASPPSGPSPK